MGAVAARCVPMGGSINMNIIGVRHLVSMLLQRASSTALLLNNYRLRDEGDLPAFAALVVVIRHQSQPLPSIIKPSKFKQH